MVTIKNYAAIVAATVLLLGACKKPEAGPAGKDGAAGANGVVPSMNDGYIKGNISGMRQDGVPFNENFDYTTYFGGPSGTIDSMGVNQYFYSITRGGTSILDYNYADINLEVPTKSASTGTLNLYFNYEKSLGSNKLFRFSGNGNFTAAAISTTYNATTRLLTGTFSTSIPGFQNSTGNTAAITGSFQATISEIVNIVKNTGTTTIKD